MRTPPLFAFMGLGLLGATLAGCGTTAATTSQSALIGQNAAVAPSAQGQPPMPQQTVAEKSNGNDGPMATIPQGTPDSQAMAAGMGTDGAPVVTVTDSGTACRPDMSAVRSGTVWFHIVNRGGQPTELYLETTAGDELAEVEKIGPGQGGAFRYTVQPGQYRVACESGMADQQIVAPLTVTP